MEFLKKLILILLINVVLIVYCFLTWTCLDIKSDREPLKTTISNELQNNVSLVEPKYSWIPKKLWVSYENVIWRGYTMPVIISVPNGRLGNQMGEYASLYALNKIYGVTVAMHPNMMRRFNKAFKNMTIQPLVGEFVKNNWILLHRFSTYNYASLEVAAAGLMGPERFAVLGNPFEMQLFNNFRHELIEDFTFLDNITNRVNLILKVASYKYTEANPGWPVKGITYVGMHVRRTDYSRHLANFGGLIPGLDYYHAAMDFFVRKFRQVLFIVASDDQNYTKENFGNNSYVFLSIGQTSEVDLALLSSCNHSIISVGSYGFWSGYLAGGIVLYPDIEVNTTYKFTKPIYQEANITNFIPIPVL